MENTNSGYLKKLGLKYGTDKATLHDFVNFYEKFFENIRHNQVNFLEIGVWKGASINMWLEYFTNEKSLFYGIDSLINYSCNDSRFTFVVTRQEKNASNNYFQDNFFDIIIDDGGHKMSEQQISLKNLWSKLKPGGLYFVEDLHTSFDDRKKYPDNWIDIRPTTYDVLKNNAPSYYPELQAIQGEFSDIEFFNRDNTFHIDSSIMCVIKKAA